MGWKTGVLIVSKECRHKNLGGGWKKVTGLLFGEVGVASKCGFMNMGVRPPPLFMQYGAVQCGVA